MYNVYYIERLILLYWKIKYECYCFVRLHVHVPGRKLLLFQTDANSYAGNFFHYRLCGDAFEQDQHH